MKMMLLMTVMSRLQSKRRKMARLSMNFFSLKDELFNSRKCCKIAIAFTIVIFGLNLVFMSLMLSMFFK